MRKQPNPSGALSFGVESKAFSSLEKGVIDDDLLERVHFRGIDIQKSGTVPVRVMARRKDGSTYMTTVHKKLGEDVKDEKLKDSKEDTPSKITLGSLEELRFVTNLGGSSGVELHKTRDGSKVAVKRERSGVQGQLKEEWLSNKLYDALGVKVPATVFFNGGVLVNEYIEGKELAATSGSDLKKAKEEIKKGFVADCLFANWDVLGADGDNVIVTPEGEVYRIDNGGALRFRARGELKGDRFGLEVKEIDTMREKASMTISDKEIAEQVKLIQEKKEKLLLVASLGGGDELSNILRQRIEYLEDRFLKTKPSPDQRDDMPSMVTQNYFDSGWDDLDFVGNAGIKDAMKAQILKIEKANERSYTSKAEDLGITVDELKEKLQKFVEQAVSESEVYTAKWNKTVEMVVEDGIFKTQFLVYSSDGSLDQDMRSETENGFFGFTDDVNFQPENRPVYGYFSKDKNGVFNSQSTIPPPNLVGMYGNVFFRVKKEKALKSATISFQDSLGYHGEMACTPYSKPHFTSLGKNINRFNSISDFESNSKHPSFGQTFYVESHIHNKLTMDDIESVHFSKESFKHWSEEGYEAALERMNTSIGNITKFIAKTGKEVSIKIF
jgi:hypothetical protein